MAHRSESPPTTSIIDSGSYYMTPSPDTSFDSEYTSYTPPPHLRRGESIVDQCRFVLSSKLPLSSNLSIPALVYPKSPAFVKKSHGGGSSKALERLEIPLIKLTPKRSGALRDAQIGR